MSIKRNRRRRETNRTKLNKLKRGSFRPRTEPLEDRLLLASDFTNPLEIHDVDGSQDAAELVTPLDALIVINELSSPTIRDPETGELPELTESDDAPTFFYDVNGDNHVNPIDALMVINHLNENAVVIDDTGQHAAAGVIVGSRAALADNISDDTRVNTTTDRLQRFPDVASTSLGSSVVVWQSLRQDGSSWGIFGQRFDQDGAAVGGEFQVNTTTRGAQTNPAVAISESGNFTVVWQSTSGADSSGFGVYGQEFSADGTAVGSEFVVNETTRGRQFDPDVAYGGDDFTVVWQGRGEGDVSGVYARTFSAGGGAGGEVLVNSTTRGFQGRPVVSANAAGNVVVAWQGRGEGDNTGVFMRDIGTGGGNEIPVNLDTSGLQRLPAVAVAEDGAITVAWHSPPDGIQARTFGAGADGGAIQVSQTEPGIQTRPDVTALTGGGFAVAWQGKGSGDHRGTHVRTFDGSGAATTDEMLVNQTTRAAQVRPAVAAANAGFIVAWQGNGAGDRRGVFARFFDTEIAGPFTLDNIANSSVDEGATFTTTASTTPTANAGTGVPVFTLDTAPAGATIDASTGVITWVTTESDGPGTFEFTVTATEGEFALSDTFNVTVNEVNLVPQLTGINDSTVLIGNPVNISAVATDADLPAQTLTYSATGLPSWLTLNTATGVFTGTPAATDEGVSTITVTVTDGNGGSASDTFVLTATNNQAPTLATEIPDATVNEADAVNLNIAGNFTDPEGDTLTFSSTTLPSWATLNPTTGVITGTPANADVGTTAVTIIASDASDSVSDTFQLTVTDVNTLSPSLLEGSFRVAPTAAAGTNVGTVLAQDLDPDSVLQFSITSGNDAGAFAIDGSTGQITVADATALSALSGDVGLTVQATDGVTTAASAPVSISVDAADAFAAYTLEIVSPGTDTVLTSVSAGQTVELVLNVQGTGGGSAGVFAAFADIVYNPDTLTLAGPVNHSDTYANGANSDLTVDGIIDEAGGSDGLSPLGDGVLEVLRVPVTIANVPAGTTIAFATNTADDPTQRATLIFGINVPLDPSQVEFGSTSVTVTSPTAAANAAVDAVFAEEDE